MLADVGGLQAFIAVGLKAILSVINYNNFNNFLVEKLYKLNTGDHEKGAHKFQGNCCYDIKEFFIDNLPSCCRYSD